MRILSAICPGFSAVMLEPLFLLIGDIVEVVLSAGIFSVRPLVFLLSGDSLAALKEVRHAAKQLAVYPHVSKSVFHLARPGASHILMNNGMVHLSSKKRACSKLFRHG
jgi:hypothetical protein